MRCVGDIWTAWKADLQSKGHTKPIDTCSTHLFASRRTMCHSAQPIFLILPSATTNRHRALCTLTMLALQQFYLLEQLPMAANVRDTSMHFHFLFHFFPILFRCPHWPYDTLLFCIYFFFFSFLRCRRLFRQSFQVNMNRKWHLHVHFQFFPQCKWCRAMVSMTPIKWTSEPRNSFGNWKIMQLKWNKSDAWRPASLLPSSNIHGQRTHAQIIHFAWADERS